MELTEIATYFFVLILGYVLGAVPFGFMLTKRFYGADIRTSGSGNIGATNVSRVAGKKLGAITLVCDIVKGAVPVYAACVLVPENPEMAMAMAGLAAFLGHLYPVYSGFRGGGKGVATACGCFLVAALPACLFALGVFTAAVLVSRRVSVGSLLAALSLPAGIWLIDETGPLLVCAAIIALFVVVRHRTNIERLFAGEEPRFF